MNKILDELRDSHPEDLRLIRLYIQWVKIRRAIHHRFYFIERRRASRVAFPSAHWV